MNWEIYKNKTVLVTGHTGFKGSWLTQWLIELGANVIGLSLENPPKESLFNYLKLKGKITHYEGTINKKEDVDSIFQKHHPEFVFHLAAQAIVKTSYEDPVDTFQTNIIGTINILEAIRRFDSVKVAIMVTSDKCYKNDENKISFKEDDPLGGNDPYSASKACAELVISSYKHSFFNFEQNPLKRPAIISVRAGNIIGGGDWSTDRIIPDCVNSISKNKPIYLRSPHAVRPWQHVLDALYAYLLISQKSYSNEIVGHSCWNIGPDNNEVIDVEQLVQKIISRFGKGEFQSIETTLFHEAKFLRLNVSKINDSLGWKCAYNVDETVNKTVDWYKHFLTSNRENAESLTIGQIRNYMNNL